MWKRVAAVLVGILALVAVGAVVMIGPRNIVGMWRYDTRRAGTLRVGDRAPDVEVVALDGQRVRLATRFGSRPLVLILGSYT